MIGNTGSFVSPNYPHPYHSRAECFWSLSVSRGSTVNIVFLDLDLESNEDCQYDYVEVCSQRYLYMIGINSSHTISMYYNLYTNIFFYPLPIDRELQ